MTAETASGSLRGNREKMLPLAAFLLISFFAGFFAISMIVDEYGWRGLPLRATLSFPLGFGILSLLLYVWLLAGGTAQQAYILLEIPFFLLLAGVYFRKFRSHSHGAVPVTAKTRRSFPYLLFLTIVCFFFLLSLLSFLKCSMMSPSGGWDAWALWNMKARFFIESGPAWQSLFDVEFVWLHTDYPLLLPLTVVRAWLYMGNPSQAAPITIAVVFTLTVPALVLVGVTQIEKYAGLLGAAFLLGATGYIEHGASQYADIPLSMYFLASTVLVCLSRSRDRRLMFAAGFFMGLSAWTKNEGAAFIIAISISAIIYVAANRETKPGFGDLRLMLLGMLIPLVFVIHFRASLAPPTDIFADQPISVLLDRLVNPARYAIIGQHLKENLFTFFGWQSNWLVVYFGWYAALSMLLAVLIKPTFPSWLIVPLLTCILTGLTYFAIYLITPLNLEWHVTTSLDRLLLQLLPIAVFGFFGFMGSTARAYLSESRKQKAQSAKKRQPVPLLLLGLEP